MKARSSFPQRHGGRLLPLRFAARELRGGLRGFYVFIACTALGVMAIAGVSSLAAGLAEGLAREGRVILGGDLAFTLSMRSANAEERAFLDRQGAVSLAATMRAMARAQDGRTTLVEVKAVGMEPSVPPPTPVCSRGSLSGRMPASHSAPQSSKFGPF